AIAIGMPRTRLLLARRWRRPTHLWTVGGHLPGNGRFSLSFSWSPASANGDAGRFQIIADRLPANAGLAFNAPERPSQSAEREDFLLSRSAQDVSHGDGGPQAPCRGQRLGRRRAGNGRF